jgi:uncharacterized protein
MKHGSKNNNKPCTKMTKKGPPAISGKKAFRLFYLSCGLFFIACGFAGILLPVLPTTPFLLLAVACFAKSSLRLEKWLLTHKKFGPTIKCWREKGAIPVSAKKAAVLGCLIGFLLFLYISDPEPLLILLVAALMGCGISYVLTRPSA